MKFKIDENLPAKLVGELRVIGHESETVLDEGLTGAADPLILERVRIEERLWLTLDIGVGDIRPYHPPPFRYATLSRPGQASPDCP